MLPTVIPDLIRDPGSLFFPLSLSVILDIFHRGSSVFFFRVFVKRTTLDPRFRKDDRKRMMRQLQRQSGRGYITLIVTNGLLISKWSSRGRRGMGTFYISLPEYG